MSSKHIKLVIFIKAIFLLGIAFSENLLSIGEMNIFAQDENAKAGEESESTVTSTLDNLLEIPTFDSSKADKENIDQYLSTIERKQDQINERIEILKIREAQLKELEASIDKKIIKIDEEILFFQQTQQKEKTLKQERLDNLVEFYKKMTPKKLLQLWRILIEIYWYNYSINFQKKQTMNILSLMNPQKAAEISEYYGRINSIKEYDMLKEVNESLSDQFEKCKVQN